MTGEPWLAVLFLLAGLACLILLLAFRSARRAAAVLHPASLSAATARALYGVMAAFHRLEQTEPEAVPISVGARVRIADTAGRLYDALPDTITVRYSKRLVPVPLKTIIGRQECVNVLTAAFWGDTAGLATVEASVEEAFRIAARRGITEERLLSYGTPLDASSGVPTA